MFRVYRLLLDRWIPEAQSGGGLKTDLFEEALTVHNLLPHMGPNTVGVDCSNGVATAARQRLKICGNDGLLVVGDLRHLPIRSCSIRYVLSGSSLDHFEDEKDIPIGFAELHRVLMPGGSAVITLDNPHNPVVWLRNHLPFAWLNRLHLVPYYVGRTGTRQQTCCQLEEIGFEVLEVAGVAHAPRAFAICLIGLLERFRWKYPAPVISRCLDAFEALQNWPTRFQTGYYLAYRVTKRVTAEGST
jgi:SAM-dependent methyltransferase